MADQTLSDLLVGIPRLVRVPLAIMGMICVFIGGVIGGFDFFGFELILAMIAVFCITAGSMAFNDVFDREVDTIVHPDRPIPSGKITAFQGMIVAVVFFLVSIVLSFVINELCFWIAVVSIDLLVLYETVFKNQGFVGNLVVAFIVGISFVFGGAAVGMVEVTVDFALLAFFLMVGREVLMDVTDVEGDRLHRVTLPMRMGRKWATVVGCVFLCVAVVFLFMPGVSGVFPGFYVWLILPVQLVVVYATVLSLKSVENTGRSADLLLVAMGIGLPVFVFSSVL